MGAIASTAKPPTPGSIAKIIHNTYTHEQEFPEKLFRIGEQCQILKVTKAYQSRPAAQPIIICTVKFADGQMESYPLSNIEVLKLAPSKSV